MTNWLPKLAVVGTFLPVCIATLSAAPPDVNKDETKAVIDRCKTVKTDPAPVSKINSFLTMDHCAALGNGNLMVSIAGEPENLNLYLGKTDFWTDRVNQAAFQSANVLPGFLNIRIPAMAGAGFGQVVDLYHAEARTTLTKGKNVVEIRSITPHEADNYVINDITNKSAAPLQVQVDTCTEAKAGFETAAGKNDGDTAWITRKTLVPEPHHEYGNLEFRMWAAIGTRVMGASAGIETEGAAKSTATFTIPPAQTVRVVTKVHSTGIPISMNPGDPLPDTLQALKAATPAKIDGLIADHRAWWARYWNKGTVKLDAEPVLERAWYGGLYIFGCANKVGSYPAGCNGWPVNDAVPWGGDYHWNYNQEAAYYHAYSSNRVELTEPYDRTVQEANGFGRRLAEEKKAPGTLFFIATGPGHLNEAIDMGQITHALEASMNQINHYYYTYDLEWMKKNYDFLKDVAAFWDWNLEQNKEKSGDGKYRYVLRGSAAMENTGNDRFNPITGLAFLRRFYRSMIDISVDLNASGYAAAGEADLARWRDIFAHLSDYPLGEAYGRKVFAWSEESHKPFVASQDWVMYPIFPGEQVNMSSDPDLLKTADNTLSVKPAYYFQFVNNTPQIFSQAVRIGHHPPEVIERLRTLYNGDKLLFRNGCYNGPNSVLGVNNFKSGGGNVEDVAVVEVIDAMLLQSQEGFLRLFPGWHHDNAKFTNLRAVGAFLVSGEKINGVCQPFSITSEKGRLCRVLNPWKGHTLQVKDSEGHPVAVTVENHAYGQICAFDTKPGKTYQVNSREKLPVSIPYYNAALYKSVTASSNYRPDNETFNWDVAKLTDGTRVNTRFGSRGWSSSLHETADAPEWVQVDLGGTTPICGVDLYPLDHGDAENENGYDSPGVDPKEMDQSWDGFPLDYRVLISTDGEKWTEVARAKDFLKTNDPKVKPDQVPGAVPHRLAATPARYVRIEGNRLSPSRYFGKYAMELAEIEVIRP
jgi:hypothetical protein